MSLQIQEILQSCTHFQALGARVSSLERARRRESREGRQGHHQHQEAQAVHQAAEVV